MSQLDIAYSPSVAAARKNGEPLVALESTIITHGMPWPRNVETAKAVEQTIVDQGAVPATIAVLNGQVHIGLDDDQLTALGQAENVMKLSRADMAFAIAQKQNGSTTVAATMMAAQWADIGVFATGGIGGVHVGAETSFDISADLQELAQTDVIVVCAGAKAILDIPKTLEILETNGVPVIGYQTDEVPAFWSRKSGIPIPLRLDTPDAIGAHAKVRALADIKGGTLITNPVPADREIPQEEMGGFIRQALENADRQGIKGKGVTPFLLSNIVDLTEGRSLETNVALIVNNAKLAAQIAVAMKR